MINLPSSQILSTDFAKYFSSKDATTFTGFIADISKLPDDQQLECVHVMASVVNKNDTVPQTSIDAITICAPYITLVNLSMDQQNAKAEKRRTAAKVGAKARWNQDNKTDKTDDKTDDAIDGTECDLDAIDAKTCDSHKNDAINAEMPKSHQSHNENNVNIKESTSYAINEIASSHNKSDSDSLLYKNNKNSYKSDKTDKTIGDISKKNLIEGEIVKETSTVQDQAPDSMSYPKSNPSYESYVSNPPVAIRIPIKDLPWKWHRDASAEEVMEVLSCPSDYPRWAVLAFGAARAVSWDVFNRWCKRGGNYDEDGCRRFYLAANRTRDRVIIITEKVIYKVYRYGLEVVRPLGEKEMAGLKIEIDKITDADIEAMKRKELEKGGMPQIAAETASGAVLDNVPCDVFPVDSQAAQEHSEKPFEMSREELRDAIVRDLILPKVTPTPLPPLSGKTEFSTAHEYMGIERRISEETIKQSSFYVRDNKLYMPYRDWQGNPLMFIDMEGRQRPYEVIRDLSLSPQAKGQRYTLPFGAKKQPYDIENFFNGSELVFMTEGEIDCLSIKDVGGICVASRDKEAFKIYDEHKSEATVKKIIIVADSDSAGQVKIVSKYTACLERGIEANILMMPKGCNDANDFKRMNTEAFAKDILEIMLGKK